MSKNFPNLAYLGVLAASTSVGQRSVEIAITGAVTFSSWTDSGLDVSNEAVRTWLWKAGINPDHVEQTIPDDYLANELVKPAVGDRMLLIHHEDATIPLVQEIQRALGDRARVTQLDLDGPIPHDISGIAIRRAMALEARYEEAIAASAEAPLRHVLDAEMDGESLSRITVDGPFLVNSWDLTPAPDSSLDKANIASFVLISLAGAQGFAYEIAPGRGGDELRRLAADLELNERLEHVESDQAA
ncbi:hypothetical protein [Sphingosinicella sp. BN140058]|uniref:hypothetical protein n=1 Tax=Sphingosinicella sp. BN140058 TaxID=1892855 RepID=UPI001011C936|nr:hypothetical protein [Sphingosinicella sp. BN140058]QAY80167.1 hypothetical protein ETR14_26350 [Sphingosinicella sp. BN140058]